MQKANPTRTEFASAIHQVAHERGLDPQIVIDTIKQAIVAAFKKDHTDPKKQNCFYTVELDPSSGEAKIFESVGELAELSDGTSTVNEIEGAKKTDVTPPGFGRIAAQTAKQVILQKIREAEKSNIVGEYEKRLGQLINGKIIRFVGNEIIVEIGKTEAVLPREEQVYSENYHLNQSLTFLLHSIRDSIRGREIVVSRSDSKLIHELFRREVPEVSSGSVEIKAIARDAGSRSKVAVYSHQSGVDPVGSCVGQKGVRVQAVIGELNGEKLDIVQFNEDMDKYIAAALSPAASLKVKVDVKSQVAEVLAPQDQLSLAIGREGQNAKLAGKLTGYHIDIKGLSEEASAESLAPEQPTTNDQVPSTNDQ